LATIAELMERRSRLILLVGVPLVILLALVRSDLDTVLRFDDAFMFWRYALHLRDGWGMVWNVGGAPTYGLTSQLWVYFVLPFTYTGLEPGRALQIASLLMGLAGLAIGALAITGSRVRLVIYLALVVLLLAIPPFAFHLTTGMDTMLGFATNAALVAALERWRGQRPGGASLVGVAAFVTILARPENVLVAFGVPGLTWLLLSPRRTLHEAALMLGLPALLLAADLALCQWVYGTALPLSFYAKSGAAYEGFLNRENPIRYMANAVPAILPSLALWLVYGRGQGRYLLVMALPVLATVLYLSSVHQIMGFKGRYYMPFVPFLLLPAARVAAEGLGRRASLPVPKLWWTLAVPAAVLVLLTGKQALNAAEATWLNHTLPAPVPQSTPIITARTPLPTLKPTQGWTTVAHRIASRLPHGAVLAASEVGAIGGYAPQLPIIDLAGLNDPEIGLQGFSADRLVARAPDLIWLPHEDYTGARAALLRSHAFRQHYRLLWGAFDHGLAIRVDGPQTAAITKLVDEAWRSTYPGFDQRDYAARWPASQAMPPAS